MSHVRSRDAAGGQGRPETTARCPGGRGAPPAGGPPPRVLATRWALVGGGVEPLGPRPRRQRAGRVLTPDLEQRILDTTLKTRPLPGTHWSVRILAKPSGVP